VRFGTVAQLSVANTRVTSSGSGYVLSVAYNPQPWEQICLCTDRLCLRTPTPQDAEAMHELFADPVVMYGLNREPVSELDETRAMIEGGIGGWRTDGLGPFILETAAPDRRVVGWSGLMIFDTRGWTPSTWTSAGSHAQPELGWALIRAHWGLGYATEAAAAIRDWAYESRSIDLLVSLISPNNVRSRRVAERLGASPTETVTPAHTKQKTVVWRHTPAAYRLARE
jgi:RimJ/RimL family protein N-acetyltransferase